MSYGATLVDLSPSRTFCLEVDHAPRLARFSARLQFDDELREEDLPPPLRCRSRDRGRKRELNGIRSSGFRRRGFDHSITSFDRVYLGRGLSLTVALIRAPLTCHHRAIFVLDRGLASGSSPVRPASHCTNLDSRSSALRARSSRAAELESARRSYSPRQPERRCRRVSSASPARRRHETPRRVPHDCVSSTMRRTIRAARPFRTASASEPTTKRSCLTRIVSNLRAVSRSAFSTPPGSLPVT